MSRADAVLGFLLGVATLLALSVFLPSGTEGGQNEQPAPDARQPDERGRPPMTLRDFMRQKLAASNQILEGLTIEDMDMVARGARTLNEMSAAERWRIHNDAMYRQFSGEFRRHTGDLLKSAEEGNLDQAALKWVSATMGCIECHRYVRQHLIAEKDEQ
jgi:hypothetical protein